MNAQSKSRARRCTVALLAGLAQVVCPAAQAQPADQAPDTLQARLMACAVCHGVHGEGTAHDYFPRLSGKPAGYLLNQLAAFRDGRRRYPPMNALLQFMPDAYLGEMAAYYAAGRVPPPPAVIPVASQAVLDRGHRLVSAGDPVLGVPACMRCHGALLTGRQPAIPGLLGLQQSYITAQLGAWRYGTRTAASPDCMQIVAGHLGESDVTAVAAWLASQPVSPDAVPIPRGTDALPLACGSEPG